MLWIMHGLVAAVVGVSTLCRRNHAKFSAMYFFAQAIYVRVLSFNNRPAHGSTIWDSAGSHQQTAAGMDHQL